jgi:HEAT repeat protein
LRPLSDADAWKAYAETLTSGDSDQAYGLLLNLLGSKGLDPGELSAHLSLEIDGFLHWLGPSLIREIEVQAVQGSTTFGGVLDVIALSALREYLDSQAAEKLSPGLLRRRIRSFLNIVDKTCEMRIDNPFAPGRADPHRLQQPARIRVTVREDVPGTLGAPDAYAPTAGRTRFGDGKVVPWEAVEAEGRNLVVLADPGLGKTRLLHLHAQLLARQALTHLKNRTELDQLKLPILVRCDELHAHPSTSLESACVDILAVKDESPAFAAWLIKHLETTQNTFLLDALDEIPGNVASLPLGHKLENWTSRSGQGRVILSSRIAGYERPHGLALTEVELLPLSSTEVHAYVDAWGLDQKSRSTVQERLKTQSFMDMARIPLLLVFICTVASQPKSLPESRGELFDRMLDQLLGERHRLRERTDGTAHVRLNEVDKDELRRILRLVALHFSNTPKGWVDRMSATELRQVVAAARPRISDALKKCVESGILTRAGIEELSNRPDYFFLHRTFAEYLLAVEIAATKKGWKSVLRDHLWFDQDWDQVLPLVGASLPNPKPYLEHLLSVRPDPLHRGLHTAARVIAELSDDQADSAQQQIRNVPPRLLKLMLIGVPEAGESLRAIANRIPETDARDYLMLLQHADQRIQLDAIHILAGRDGNDVTLALLDALNEQTDTTVRMAIVEALSDRDGDHVTLALLNAVNDKANRSGSYSAIAQALSGRDGDQVTVTLLNSLNDQTTSPMACWCFAQALAGRPGDDVTAALINARSHANSQGRTEATVALSGRPGNDVTATMINALNEPTSDYRVFRAIEETLAARHVDGVAASLINALANQTNDPSVWRLAARALASHPGHDVTAALINALTHPDPHTQGSAAQALKNRPGDDVTAALINALSHPDPQVQEAAAQALTGRNGDDVTAALVNALTHQNSPAQSSFALGLTGRPGIDVTTALINALANQAHDPSVRGSAALALTGREGAYVTAALLNALTEQANDTVAQARFQEAILRSSDFTAAMVDLLRYSHPWVPQCAARALAGRPGDDVTAALLNVLTDADPQAREDRGVRAAAMVALAGRPGDDVTAALLNALTDQNEGVRWSAVHALAGRLGDGVATALLKALTDLDEEVATEAGATLQSLPGNCIVDGLHTLIGTSNDEQALGIIMRVHPLAWSVRNMEPGDRQETLRLLGILTDSIA